MKNVLIVFSGKARSGKSTAANLLKYIWTDKYINELSKKTNIIHVSKESDQILSITSEDYKNVPDYRPLPAQIISFASALKDIAKKYFFWDGDKNIYYTDSNNTEIVSDKGRQLLINIGQAFRAIRPNVWSDYVLNEIQNTSKIHKDEGLLFIIDDLRFKNELEICKKFDVCFSVRITRSDSLNLNDISETNLDDSQFDYYLDNNGSTEDLTNKLKELLKNITQKIENS